MVARRKIIIDTDPGVDDVLAMLLALSAAPEEVEILLLSLTHGNVEVEKCLRNVVHMFHHIHLETQWRQQRGLPAGFGALLASRPFVAVGAKQPLAEDLVLADYFHGTDGLGGIDQTHPHLSPDQSWHSLFDITSGSKKAAAVLSEETSGRDQLFRPSQRPAHEEILRLLAENDPDQITIVAVGPMTNTALAAAQDPEVFLRVKEVVVMGGAVHVPGNITPLAEFNTAADSYAAARVYALTSPKPQSTMPPEPPLPAGLQTSEARPPYLSHYPTSLPRQLKLTLFPLDITCQHLLPEQQFRDTIDPLKAQGSPLAIWADAFVTSTCRKVESLRESGNKGPISLEMHDPLCIWYCLRANDEGWKIVENEDLRVETSGQWTRGMCVVDGRDRKRREDGDVEEEISGDHGNWLSARLGNRLRRCTGTPGDKVFAIDLLKRIFQAR